MKKALLFTAFAAAFALCLQTPAFAEPKRLASKEDGKALFDSVMSKIVAGDVAGAFGDIEPHFPLDESELAAMKTQMIQQRNLMKPRFGNSEGFEYLGEKSVNDIFVKFAYIEKFEKHAIEWSFILYHPKDGWIVNSIYFDDKIVELLR